jgi:predicted regulator of Ras-like GTPase activity (Roadblock/LC7/MglB family)
MAPSSEVTGAEKAKSTQGEHKMSLALKPILLALPPFQLAGDLKDVADDVRIEVPFSLVEAQLASGRIALEAEEFEAVLPEQYRNLFSAKEIKAPVVLPLQDVLKNLPTTSLRIRDDQEEQEKGAQFQTPFAAAAAEDAKRFGAGKAMKPLKGLPQVDPTPAAPAPAPAKSAKAKIAEPAAPKIATPEVPAATAVKPAAPLKPEVNAPSNNGASEKNSQKIERNALQNALNTDDEVDAKAVVAHAGKFEGVKGCAIIFRDGLSLAGELPGEFQADGLCAMAPSFLQRIDDHMSATKLGAFSAMTLSCAKAAVTFFMHDNLCLAALHAKVELAPDVREFLANAVCELSRKYSHPA